MSKLFAICFGLSTGSTATKADQLLYELAECPAIFNLASFRHGSDTDESDLDILVDTTPDTTLFDLGAIRYKLRNLLGVQVDVLTPGALPDKFRQTVISEARPV